MTARYHLCLSRAVRLAITRCLHFKHLGVTSAQTCQLVVSAFLCDLSILEDQDAVRRTNGGEAMRNKKRHLPGSKFGKAVKYFELAARIECGSGFVENQQLRVAKISPRQGDFLPFATGKIDPLFEAAPKHLVVAVGESSDGLIGHALLRCAFQ